MYKLLKPLLFLLPPEQAHRFVKAILHALRYVPFSGILLRAVFNYKSPILEREVLGLKFPNPIGVAGGFDKFADLYNALANFGFGFVEIGSITPEKQEGNPRPRCWRLPQDHAIINCMGINNPGSRVAAKNLKQDKPHIIVAANLASQATTPHKDAYKDFQKSFALLYDFVDFFILNVSCPNVKDLSELQNSEFLDVIVSHLTRMRRYCEDYRPILLKLSPDLSVEELDVLTDYVLNSALDGVVVCNTTKDYSGLTTPEPKRSQMHGGLSGAPLKEKSLAMIRRIHQRTGGLIPIIGTGGVMSPQDAQDMLDAGASLVEVYSGFIYEGPGLVKRILKHLNKQSK